MLRSAARTLVGPVVERMIIRVARSRGELPEPSGEPRVHAMGIDPDRILILGAGVVRGIGVASHELGLGGQLARQLSALTGRGADVELLGLPGITVSRALRLLADIDLGRFDALVVMLGNREAIRLHPVAAWERDIRALLGLVAASAPTLSVFVVGLSSLPRTLPLSGLLGPMVDREAERLNDATERASAATGAFFIPFNPDERALGDIGSTATYVAWATPIARGMHEVLGAATPVSHEELPDEALRQASLDAMDILDRPPTARLDAIARSAKDLFGVAVAAVNLIDRDRLHSAAAAGVERGDASRSESFCAVTVRLGGALVIEDTRLDPRVNSLAAVNQGFLFYAGYPIEAPNGQRVGTLCLLDVRPRAFTNADESLLRQLALRAQAELWSAGSGGRR